MTVGDIEDDFQTLTYTFTGIPEIMLQLGQQISGAFGIPLVRLFGQSPAGLNSTGESDIRSYYDNIKKLQRSMMRSGLKRILDVAYMSVTGQTPPDDLSFDFSPLWQVSSLEKSQIAAAEVAAIQGAYADRLISLPTALKELKALSDTVGLFASITDEDIAEAAEFEAMEPPEGAFNEEEATNFGNGVSGTPQDSRQPPLV